MHFARQKPNAMAPKQGSFEKNKPMSKIVIATPGFCADPPPCCAPTTAATQVSMARHAAEVREGVGMADRPAADDESPATNPQLPCRAQDVQSALERIRRLAILLARQAAAEDDDAERRKGHA